MTTKQLFVAGYDDGHGFKVIDPSTGELVRQVQGSWWTDNMMDMVVEGNNVWLLDTDSSLVRADLDGVVKVKVDIGYIGTADTNEDTLWAMYVTSDFLYHLHTINTNNPNPGGGLAQGDPQPADGNILYLIKRNKTTLSVVSETKLDHASLGDSAGNQNFIKDKRVICWMSDGFWVPIQDGPKNQFAIKVGYDGVPTGAEIDLTAINGFDSWFGSCTFWASPEKYVQMNLQYTGDWSTNHTIGCSSGYVFDFTGAGSYTAIGSWTAGPFDSRPDMNGFGGQGMHPRVTGDVLSWPEMFSEHAWVGGPNDGKTGAWRQFSINFFDGTGMVLSDPVLLPRFDMVPVQNSSCECWSPYSADKFFMADERHGVWLVNFTTAVVDYTTGYNFMQGYSSDATEIDSGIMVTVPVYTLAGTVTDGGTPVAGRTVFIYDQETGGYIGKTQTNGSGQYTFTTFTNTPKFAVCPSTDNTKNFKVNAHLTPA